MDDDINLIKFRFTPYTEEFDYNSECQFINEFVGITQPQFMTCGFEKLNNLGEPYKPHYHIHIATKKTIGAIRKAFSRTNYYKEAPSKGNALYSLTEEDDVKDLARFFRYPFKQGGRIRFRESLPPDFDLSGQLLCAREEYANIVKVKQEKREKLLSPTTCDKIMEYLEGLEVKPINDIDILEQMILYYAERGSSANKQTLIGFMNTYKVRNKIISAREMAQLWLN